ncbi:MAG TPA: hypothetical protein VN922_22675 [Bacteroidia bacterium]|nr:hypothetical protein [Bacteroidia bacterium]
MSYKQYIFAAALLCIVSVSVYAQTDLAKQKRIIDSLTALYKADSAKTKKESSLSNMSRYQVYDSVYHHTDTALAYQLIIKINPGLLFTEQGLSLQYNLLNNFGIELGFGYNEDNSGNPGFHTYDGNGYTYRAGVIQYLDAPKRWYFQFSGFYRYYHKLSVVSEDAEGFTQGIDDEVINPLRANLANVSAGDGNQVDAYTAKVRVFCIDAIMGYQYRHKHFVLDVFGGLGERSKYFSLREIGYYPNAIGTTNETMIPINVIESKGLESSYVDVKLGFTIGYRFF